MSGHVLVVDDDADIREVLEAILGGNGFRVSTASNGKEALDLLAALPDPPCAILLDLMMPVMDGAAFRHEQLQRDAIARIPVVVMSAFRDAAAEAKALAAAAFLKKPMTMSDLVQTVRSLCAGG